MSKGLCLKGAACKTNPFNCHCRFHALCETAINPASAHACPHRFTPSEKPLLRTALAGLVKQLPPGYVRGFRLPAVMKMTGIAAAAHHRHHHHLYRQSG